jgi:transcriptional regulator with XRE-family HTH domain
MAALRAQGLSFAEIGRRLGVTKQAVHATLKKAGQPRVRGVPCRGCGRFIVSAGALPQDGARALCLPCLKRKPRATFGQRLKAYRLDAGLTRTELARRAGISQGSSIHGYEDDRFLPLPPNRVRLARALRVPLKALGPDATAAAKPGRPPRRKK